MSRSGDRMSQHDPSSMATADHDPLLSKRFPRLTLVCLLGPFFGDRHVHRNPEHSPGLMLLILLIDGRTRPCSNGTAVVAVMCHS